MIDFSKPCESFEQACAEFISLITTPQWRQTGNDRRFSTASLRRLTPLGSGGRWHRYLVHDFQYFSDLQSQWEAFGEVFPGVDIGFVYGSTEREDMLFAYRFRSVLNGKNLRGRVFPIRYATQYLGEEWLADLGGDGEVRINHDFIGTDKATGTVVRVDTFRRKKPQAYGLGLPSTDAAGNLFLTACSVAFSLRYEWLVVIGAEDNASILVPVERMACKELFRLRDIPEGKARRAALLHFVTQHWKRSRSQAPAEDPAVFVREHLRGQTKFTWNGLTCEVIPPKYDVERLAAAKAGASGG